MIGGGGTPPGTIPPAGVGRAVGGLGPGRGAGLGLVALGMLLLLAWLLARPPGAPLASPALSVRTATLAFAWPEYRARTALTADERRELVRALRRVRPAGRGTVSAPPGPHFAYWRLEWTDAAGRRHDLLISREGRFFQTDRGHLDRTEALWAVLAPVTRRLADAFFGEPLPWPQVDRLWPWDAVASLRDLETGRTLRVVRYGGYRHADAEPLTRQDTAVLRSLFGGAWSWRRRAVVLEVGGRRVAASINGMPHGEDIVAGNDFDGHFCVHTLAATTHASDRVDPGHHLMVLKSSGQLVDALRSAPPHAVASWLSIALANGDAATAAHMVTDPRDPAWTTLARRLTTLLAFVEVERATTLAVQGPRARVRLQGTAYYASEPPAAHLDLTWTMIRQDGFWTVAADDVADLLPSPHPSGRPAPAPPSPSPADPAADAGLPTAWQGCAPGASPR